MKRYLIIGVIAFISGFLSKGFVSKESYKKEFEPKEAMVKNAFKIGCEFTVLKNNIPDKEKEFCVNHLRENPELVRKLIESNK